MRRLVRKPSVPSLRKRIGIIILALLAGCSQPPSDGQRDTFRHEFASGAVPWTSDQFDDQEGKFTFAIVGDLNGGERERVFEIAIEQLSILRPELIMTVGDLIDGVTEDSASLHAEWDSFDERARNAPAPLFRVGGNHDLTAGALRDVWVERYGALYYHFIYKDVLFFVLDTEDYTAERRDEIRDARNTALPLSGQALAQSAYFQMPERRRGEIGAEQSAYVQRVIAENPDVRWTLLFMHKPVWERDDEPDFAAIESALSDRPYSVFNGHYHVMSHQIRRGRDYTMLSTTGGGQNPSSDMAFDHVTLVTMTEEGPSIAHLRMDGILDRTGAIPAGGDSLCFQQSRCGAGR